MREIGSVPTTFRLREILEAKGLTQKKLAAISKVSLPTISRMCRNETGQVSLITLDKLAWALSVEPGDLIVREKKGKK